MRNILCEFVLSSGLAAWPLAALAQLENQPPTITTQPVSQSIACLGDVTFSVTATGDAPLSYFWRADGKLIGTTTSTTNASLNLTNILYADGTRFTVVVSNKVGMVASEPAILTVTNSPVPTLSITKAEAGPSFPVVSWPHSCSPFILQSTMNLFDSASWFPAVVPLNDTNNPAATNTYTTSYTNYLGPPNSGSNLYYRLAAALPPKITTQPVSITTAAGSDVTFSVSATNLQGTLPLFFQWRLNGIALTNPIIQTNSLTLTNVHRTNSGSYDVVVYNTMDAVRSEIATLTVTNSTDVQFPLANAFTNRVTTNNVSNAINGSNVGATKELFETNHAGILGGKSVWLEWQAPANGIATFDTKGSAFDTLLAVYTGTTVSNLTSVTSDDDSGGYYTSQVQFNAVADTKYEIAIDGFAGDSGNIFLNWKLEVTGDQIPQIKTQPQSQTALIGANATFTVVVDSAFLPLAYQWKVITFDTNGFITKLVGTPTNELVITNVQLADVGMYSVIVSNTVRSVESTVARLDLVLERTGTNLFLPFSSESQFQDKLEVRLEPPPEGQSLLSFGKPKPRPKPQTLSVSFGSIIVATAGSGLTQGWDWRICGYAPIGTLYGDVVPQAPGTLYIDTFGSTSDTLLEVLMPSGAIYCNDNVGASLQSQVVVGGALANVHYPVTLATKQGTPPGVLILRVTLWNPG